MNVTFKVNEKISIGLESENIKGAFEALAGVSEIFSEAKCGVCGNTENLRYQVREVEDNKFYELRCKCGATFSFGQHKKGGTLFPRRKDSDGKVIPNSGWVKWEGKKD